MAADTAVAASPEETLESLLREVEALKQKLEEERQKLNDVTRTLSLHFLIIFFQLVFDNIILSNWTALIVYFHRKTNCPAA